MWQENPVTDTEYTYNVTIWVEPGVPILEFMPFVGVQNLSGSGIPYPAGTGSSVSKYIDGVGTWTGEYNWSVMAYQIFILK